MTTTRTGEINLKVWLSLGMGIITVLVLAVALGLLSQDGQNVAGRPPDGSPIPTGGTGSQPASTDGPDSTDNGPDATAPGTAPSVPGTAVLAAANRACRDELPEILALAERADTVADAGDLRGAAARLNRTITELAQLAETSRRWDPTLDLGRDAIQLWDSAAAGEPDAATYDRRRRAGLDLVSRMQVEMAGLGATGCAG
jgi:hypothetical protein